MAFRWGRASQWERRAATENSEGVGNGGTGQVDLLRDHLGDDQKGVKARRASPSFLETPRQEHVAKLRETS